MMTLGSLAGCREESRDVDVMAPPAKQPTATTPPEPTVITIAILGDPSRVELHQRIATGFHGNVTTVAGAMVTEFPHPRGRIRLICATADQPTTTHGRLAWEADLAVLAVDAANGPVPLHREHVLLARQMDVPDIALALTNTQLVEDPELLELEELELRELLKANELPGDDVICVYDQPPTRGLTGGVPRGPREIVAALGTVARSRTSEPLTNVQRLPATVYVLNRSEGHPTDGASLFPLGKVTVLMRGKPSPAQLVLTSEIELGSVMDVELIFETPVQVAIVQRFALLSDDHVAAVGVFLPR